MPVTAQIAAATQALLGSLKTVVPSQGIPSQNSPSQNLSTWTVIEIYPNGKKRGRGISGQALYGASMDSSAASTWVLPLPIDLAESNSFNWENTDFGIYQQSIAAFTGGEAAPKGGIWDIISGTVKGIFGTTLDAIGAEGAEQLRGAMMRDAANPSTESLFKAPNLRTFQFSWNLVPLKKQDADNIFKFKQEMMKYIYPEKAGVLGVYRLKYPAEFQVSFFARGTSAQKKIFSTFPAACTEFTINYGMQGVYGVHEDGNPSQVTISATFQEIYMLIQQDME